MRIGTGAVAVWIAIFIVGGTLIWVYKHDHATNEGTAGSPVVDAKAKPATEPAIQPDRISGLRSPPLPPPATPLAIMFDELQRRADRGDGHAACRLAVELIECRQVGLLLQPVHTQSFKSSEAELENEGSLPAADDLASMQLGTLESSERCVGIDESRLKLAGIYLAQAAKAGIGEAMIRYADGQGLATGNSLYGVLQDKAFDQWRRDAPGLLQEALRRGEPGAAVLLMLANSDDNSLLGGLIVDDPVQAYSYRLLLHRLRGKADIPATGLTSLQKEQARTNSARMHAEYFNHAILADRDALRPPLTLEPTRIDGAKQRTPCE